MDSISVAMNSSSLSCAPLSENEFLEADRVRERYSSISNFANVKDRCAMSPEPSLSMSNTIMSKRMSRACSISSRRYPMVVKVGRITECHHSVKHFWFCIAGRSILSSARKRPCFAGHSSTYLRYTASNSSWTRSSCSWCESRNDSIVSWSLEGGAGGGSRAANTPAIALKRSFVLLLECQSVVFVG